MSGLAHLVYNCPGMLLRDWGREGAEDLQSKCYSNLTLIELDYLGEGEAVLLVQPYWPGHGGHPGRERAASLK